MEIILRISWEIKLLSIDHQWRFYSNMDTDRQRNIEVIVTYAATTFVDIRTTGVDESALNCPAVPYAMDGGQTDRERKR